MEGEKTLSLPPAVSHVRVSEKKLDHDVDLGCWSNNFQFTLNSFKQNEILEQPESVVI